MHGYCNKICLDILIKRLLTIELLYIALFHVKLELPLVLISIILLQNHVIERIWVEVNGRVNYPIKAALIEMQEDGAFNLEHEDTKYYISWYTMRVSQVGTTMFVKAWNEHRISGKCTMLYY